MCIDPFYTGSKPYKIISDGNKGIYINYSPNNQDYYYARIDYSGNILWQIPSRIESYGHQMVSDENNNLYNLGFITYQDNIILEKLVFESITSDGNYLTDLVSIVDTANWETKINNAIFSNSLLIFTWSEGPYPYLNYFQVIDKNGKPKFNNKGIVLFNSGWYVNKKIINSGGDFIFTSNNEALKLNIDGEYLWGNNPVVFTNRNLISPAFTSDGMGGFIVIWQGYELVGIFGQQVSKNGNLGEILTSINDDDNINSNPNSFKLFQNYPNPFNPITVINFSIKETGLVKLKVYDILGREVAELVHENKEAGYHSIEFNASNLTSGVYIYNLQVNEYSTSQKMLLLK